MELEAKFEIVADYMEQAVFSVYSGRTFNGGHSTINCVQATRRQFHNMVGDHMRMNTCCFMFQFRDF
jgi:hypothetical protein